MYFSLVLFPRKPSGLGGLGFVLVYCFFVYLFGWFVSVLGFVSLFVFSIFTTKTSKHPRCQSWKKTDKRPYSGKCHEP